MIDKKKAIEIAKHYIASEFGDDIILVNDSVTEHQFVFIFYYRSKQHIVNPGYTDIFLGPGPNIVDKYDGSVTSFPFGEIEDEVVVRYYDEKGYTHNLVLDEDSRIDKNVERIMGQDEIDIFLKEFFQ